MMMIFIEQPDDWVNYEAANTLGEKLAKQAKEGAVIRLTTNEFELMKSAHIVGLGTKSNNEIDFIEIKHSHSYIAVCSKKVRLKDIEGIKITKPVSTN